MPPWRHLAEARASLGDAAIKTLTTQHQKQLCRDTGQHFRSLRLAASQSKVLNADARRFTQNTQMVRRDARSVSHTEPSALLTWQITAARGYFPMHCS
jgi:hypothetical protein